MKQLFLLFIFLKLVSCTPVSVEEASINNSEEEIFTSDLPEVIYRSKINENLAQLNQSLMVRLRLL